MFKNLYPYLQDKLKLSYNKKKYDNILDDPNNKFGRKVNTIIIFLVIISVLVLVFESVGDFVIIYKKELFILDFFISTVFLYEYLYRILRAKEKGKFILNPLNIVDLLSFLPFFIGLVFASFLSAEILKVFRLIRIFRVLKLAKHINVLVGFFKSLKDYKREYRAVGMLFIIVLTIVSILVYHVEYASNPAFATIPDAFWWGIVTMTTVGYGDMYPITTAGKLIGSVLIILGPVLLAVMSAITILVFMDAIKRSRAIKHKKERKRCPRCSRKNRKTAHFCIRCGKKLI